MLEPEFEERHVIYGADGCRDMTGTERELAGGLGAMAENGNRTVTVACEKLGKEFEGSKPFVHVIIEGFNEWFCVRTRHTTMAGRLPSYGEGAVIAPQECDGGRGREYVVQKGGWLEGSKTNLGYTWRAVI